MFLSDFLKFQEEQLSGNGERMYAKFLLIVSWRLAQEQ